MIYTQGFREAVQQLVTNVVEHHGAFGMVFNEVQWEAGACHGDLSHPKGKTLEALTEQELLGTIRGVCDYIDEAVLAEVEDYKP